MIVSAYRQLSVAEKVFVDSYLSDCEQNAQKTGVRLQELLARPLPSNLGPRITAIMGKPIVQAAIAERARELTEAMELSVPRVLKEVAALAFSNIRHYMTISDDGQPHFDLTRCTPEQLACIKSIKITADPKNPYQAKSFEFVLHDKQVALGRLMEFMGMTQPGNTVWANMQAENVKAERIATVPGMANDNQAADMYDRMINGG